MFDLLGLELLVIIKVEMSYMLFHFAASFDGQLVIGECELGDRFKVICDDDLSHLFILVLYIKSKKKIKPHSKLSVPL